MENAQGYIKKLKEELESGRKSIRSLKAKLSSWCKRGLSDNSINGIIDTLRKNPDVKITRGGWFWATEYFSLKNPANELEKSNSKSKKDKRKRNVGPTIPKSRTRPKTWQGVCPWPPPQNVKIISCDEIWLPDPTDKDNFDCFPTIRELRKLFQITNEDIENFQKNKKTYPDKYDKQGYSKDVKEKIWESRLKSLKNTVTQKREMLLSDVLFFRKKAFIDDFTVAATRFDYSPYVNEKVKRWNKVADILSV